jgi:peptidoglycan/xylan/chitin deacetylase (PgdA/CDA1 family)
MAQNMPPVDKALIAITIDLEMSRHYPRRGALEWDYCKGDLDEATKRYAVDVCRRVKKAGGKVHGFLLGRTLEQANIDWLVEILRDGHALGNHTYDHVKLNARTSETVQMRFQRCPWLIEGQTPQEAVAGNIRLTERAMQHRLGQPPNGFRTPYGYPNGLGKRPDLQTMLLEMGYAWVSSQYTQPQNLKSSRPTAANYAAIVRSVKMAQPYAYPTGLIEIPLAPITDVNAFRSRRWTLVEFAKSVRRSLRWAIEHGGVYDYCFHPSVMCIEDPQFAVIDLICEEVRQAGKNAAIVNLNTIAERAATQIV